MFFTKEMTAQTPATAEIENWLRFRLRFFIKFWLRPRNRCQVKFPTPRHVHMHRVLFYISNTLGKLMIRAKNLVFWQVCRLR